MNTMKMKLWLAGLLLLMCFAGLNGQSETSSFHNRFEEIKKTANKQELYGFLWAVPKGGDLHNHFGTSFLADDVYRAATDPTVTRGNEFYTRVRFNVCPGGFEPFIRFRTIQRSTFLKLSDCEKGEYESLKSLSPELGKEWLSSLMLDKPGEGRNEFFEVMGSRRGEILVDPNVSLYLLVKQMQFMRAQNMLYLETQFRPNFRDQDGQTIPEGRALELVHERLGNNDAQRSGVTVRFLASISRFAPDAEARVEETYAFLDRNRDFWVGMNMAGREDNDKGYPLRFMEVHKKLRRTYSNIRLTFHGGEVDSPGRDVLNTLLLGAERIGHGVNLISDPETMLFMRHNRYLVEINLISNRLLEYTPDISKHPFPEYLRLGIPVCLNTDDPGAWDSNMTDEYYTALTNFNLTWEEIVLLGRNSLQYSFLEEPVKTKLMAQYDAAVHQFETEYAGDWRSVVSGVKPAPSGYAKRQFGL